MEAKRNKTVVLNSFWSILVLLITFSTMMSSCVEGDLYDLYDEDLNINNAIPKNKITKDVTAPIYFSDKECVTWALCYLKMGNNRDIDRDTKELVIEEILTSEGITVTDKMRRKFLSCSEEYLNLVNAGINASKFKGLASNLGLGTYDTVNIGTNHGEQVKQHIQNLNGFSQGKVLVRTNEESMFHLWFLSSTQINGNEITCFDHSSSSSPVNVNSVLGFLENN